MKPDNFIVGAPGKQHIIYIVDFGLAKRYKDVRTKEHIAFSDGKDITGTVRYASVNNHNGFEQSRRDDMESLGFTVLYLFKGRLPWQGIKRAEKAEKYEAIKQAKESLTDEEASKDIPVAIVNYIKHCRELKFEQRPNYEHLKRLFKDAYAKEGFARDNLFDWFVQKSAAPKEKVTLERRRVISNTNTLNIRREKENIRKNNTQETYIQSLMPSIEFYNRQI